MLIEWNIKELDNDRGGSMQDRTKGKRTVRAVRKAGAGPTMPQAHESGSIEETSGDPFEAVAGGKAWASPTRTICWEFDTGRTYWHRDLKYPVIVRG
jgi:hypothetical protein